MAEAHSQLSALQKRVLLSLRAPMTREDLCARFERNWGQFQGCIYSLERRGLAAVSDAQVSLTDEGQRLREIIKGGLAR